MSEQFATLAVGTLNATILAASNSLVLSSSQQAALFPTSGTFRIRIDNEIIAVGAVSGTMFLSLTRGTEGTTAADHAAGTPVISVLTAAALGGQSDAAWATPSLRTLGTGSQQAAPGTLAADIVFPEASGALGNSNGTSGNGNDDAAALNAALALSVGKTLWLTGKYRCGSQLVVPAGVEIHFATPNAALIKDYASTASFGNAFIVSQNRIVAATGATVTNGSPVLTGLSTTTGVLVGDLVAGAGIDAGSYVQSVDSSSQVTMTKNAFAAGSGVTINFSTKQNDIRITGNGSIYATSTAMTGILIGILGDRFHFENFNITCWAKADAISGGGDHWRGWNVTMTGSDGQLGTTGLRYQMGDGSVFGFLHIESGDDSLQYVPSGSSGSALFNQSITRCTYFGCTGSSAMARFMCVMNRAAGGPGGMSNYITDSEFIACRGFGNTRAVFVLNRDSSGDIDGITFQDCSVDTLNSQSQVFTGTTVANTGPGGVAQVTNLDTSQLSIGLTVAGPGMVGGPTIASIDTGNQITLTLAATVTGTNQTLTFGGYGQTVLVNRSSGTSPGVPYYSGVGALKNIYFRRLTVKNPIGTNTTVGTAGVGLQNIVVDNCNIPASSSANASAVNLIQTTTARVLGGQIDCGGYNLTGVVFGGSGNANSDSIIDGTRIIGVSNGQFGVNFSASAGGQMKGVRVEQFSGQTTAKAWKTTSSSSGILIRGNDFSQLSNSSKFLDQATDTTVGDHNLGDTTSYGSPYNANAPGGVGGPPLFVRRTSDSTTTNSSTVANDDTLTVAMGASDVWQIEVFLIVTASDTTADFKAGLSTPAGATGYWGAVGNTDSNLISWGTPAANTTPLGSNTTFGAIAAGTFNGVSYASYMGIVVGDGVHAGSITVQWAANTGGGTNVGLKAQSFMRCTRIA